MLVCVGEGKGAMKTSGAKSNPNRGWKLACILGIPSASNKKFPVRIVGPADAAQAAGTLRWARFIQGKAVAAILQTLGALQGTP